MKRKLDLLLEIYKGMHLVESVPSTPENAEIISQGYQMVDDARRDLFSHLVFNHNLTEAQVNNIWFSSVGKEA